ncbi:tripartite tricarboxylate transporter permease [Ornithinicoccus halotolerans]|uniref:tripartite tricarboxylate transporter permease n=1 Tax=Ornithinicoccus halotolerans TaxID=1748220 RepID=UPI0012960F9E|nr:tripartite tricarboxylate transporter permease [Ornithinicoccus halotolerans]
METLTEILAGLQAAVSPVNILYCFVGVTLGTIIGMLPGLGSATGVALLLPLTLTLDPLSALIMLAGIYYGSQYGATISTVLVATPGDSSSAVVLFDGYPMAQQGRAGGALASAAIASFVGGTTSLIVLMAALPMLSAVALQFGPPETVALAVLGLLSIAGFTGGGSLVKGIAAAAFGVLIATIGLDAQSGQARYTFGRVELFGGLGYIEVIIGIIAVAEVFRQMGRGAENPMTTGWRDMMITRDELRRTWRPAFRGSAIGFVLGILPGVGATLASFFSYDVEKRLAGPRRHLFGTGMVEGVAGPESANNAATNGSFAPTLTLGIPGSGTTAVLLGAFLVFGLQPGPLLLEQQPTIVWGLIISFWIGNLILLVLNLPLAPAFAYVLRVPYGLMYPFILFLCLAGAYSLTNRMWSVWVTLIFGVIGFLMQRYGYPVIPVILGLILGPIMETGLARSLSISHGDPTIFLTRPGSLALLLLAAALVMAPPLIRRIYPTAKSQPAPQKEARVDSK